MNLFVIGWKLPKEQNQKILAELKRMNEIFPRLDPETLWHWSSTNGTLFMASMHTANKVVAPKRYVMQSKKTVVFYSGLPVNSSGSFQAHRAEALASNWDKSTENLDGMYCVVRAQDNPAQFTLITDIVGMEQIFYFQKNGLWLISNSVRLIERICKQSTLDPLGISLYISNGFVWDDRTLLSDIRVIPGGQRWSWKEGEDKPNRTCYFKPSELARLRHKKFTKSDYKRLAFDLTQSMRIIGQSFDNMKCALTGGRDSRFVASLLIHAGLPVQYYTYGEPSGTDAKIAKQIAETFSLNYKFMSITSMDAISNWDEMCRQIVLQGDGMVLINRMSQRLALQTLQHDHLYIDLGGTGGELARGYYSTPDLNLFLNRYDNAMMQNFMARKVSRDYGRIVRQEAIGLAHNCMSNFVAQHIDCGFAPTDIPDVFFLYSFLGRKKGMNKRADMQFQDFFSPFFTRAFIEAVFSITAAQRYTELFHYNIIRLLPELCRIPFDKGHLRSHRYTPYLIDIYKHIMLKKVQRKIKSILKIDSKKGISSIKSHTASNMFDHVSWYKAKREKIREICLDQNNSLIWDFVDRPAFEKVTSSPPDARYNAKYGAYITLIFRIVTLFYYESSINADS